MAGGGGAFCPRTFRPRIFGPEVSSGGISYVDISYTDQFYKLVGVCKAGSVLPGRLKWGYNANTLRREKKYFKYMSQADREHQANRAHLRFTAKFKIYKRNKHKGIRKGRNPSGIHQKP